MSTTRSSLKRQGMALVVCVRMCGVTRLLPVALYLVAWFGWGLRQQQAAVTATKTTTISSSSAQHDDLDHHRFLRDEQSNRNNGGVSQGIMFFAYGMEEETTAHYTREAFVSARRIKSLNPTVNITLVTNPGLKPDITGAFDLVINVEEGHMLTGEVPSWTPNGFKREWFTRLQYLSRSPYEVTLALDSQALCCTSGVAEILEEGPGEFDIAFAVQGPKALAPHNWVLMYRLNENTRRLFRRWRVVHMAKSRAGSDQMTLHMAAGSLALQGKLNVGIVSESVALATIPYSRTDPPWPRSSPLIAPGPVHFVHYNAYSRLEEETTCGRLNEDSSRSRVVFQPSAMPRSKETNVRTKNTWEMKYSEEELAEAATKVKDGALYFRGLDWENATGKFGHNVTPWREHYSNCWADLYKDVDEGLGRLMDNPAIRGAPAFAAEFHDDILWPL